jgi:hypothetical protein
MVRSLLGDINNLETIKFPVLFKHSDDNGSYVLFAYDKKNGIIIKSSNENMKLFTNIHEHTEFIKQPKMYNYCFTSVKFRCDQHFKKYTGNNTFIVFVLSQTSGIVVYSENLIFKTGSKIENCIDFTDPSIWKDCDNIITMSNIK